MANSERKATNMETENRGCEQPHSVYVVLHGELAIFDATTRSGQSPYIDVYAPSMTEHVYLAGPWLGEQHIPTGTILTLDGVQAGQDSLANYASSFLVLKGVNPFPTDFHMALRLPRPKQFIPRCLNQLDKESVTINSYGVSILLPDASSSPVIAECCVLKYALTDGVTPALRITGGTTPDIDFKWTGLKKKSGSYCLHVFAEGDAVEKSAEHAAQAFRLAAKLLGVNASLVPKKRNPQAQSSIDELWDGETSTPLGLRVIAMRDFVSEVENPTGQARLPGPNIISSPERNDSFTCGPISGIPADN